MEKLLLQKPDNPIQFIIDHLSKSYPEAVSKGSPTQAESVAASLLEQDGKPSLELSSDDDDDESDDDLMDLQSIPIARRTRRRTAISAPVINVGDIKMAESKSFEKSPDQYKRIQESLQKNLLFQNLDGEQMHKMIDAFMPQEFSADSDIITQGDEGTHFFLLESGEAAVYVTKNEHETMKVMTYEDGSGAVFGELALMYNAPRAATVRAVSDCRVWALDQVTFKQIVVNSNLDRYERQIEFLKNVKILSSLDEDERRICASSLKRIHYNAGQVIVRQGDKGKDFYIVEKGEVLCTAQESPEHPPKNLLKLTVGEYFGEIALLTGRPRQATVTALQATTCLKIDRITFKRKLGNLKEILQRNMESYKEFVTEHV